MANGPHAHWSHYDEALEMAAWAAVQAGFLSGRMLNRESPEAVALGALARSYGYGEADSYLTDVAGLSPEEIEDDSYKASLRDQYQNLWDGDYAECIDKSESELLRAVAALPKGVTGIYDFSLTVRDFVQVIRNTYLYGREDREKRVQETA